MDDQVARLERIVPNIPPCRCCGRDLGIMDGITQAVRDGWGIHTRCMPKHWGSHSHGKKPARCRNSAKYRHE
jgi:hypothetical protein